MSVKKLSAADEIKNLQKLLRESEKRASDDWRRYCDAKSRADKLESFTQELWQKCINLVSNGETRTNVAWILERLR